MPRSCTTHKQRYLRVGKKLSQRFFLLRFFLCEQLPQHLISRLVARRITFGDGYEFAVTLDIFVLDEIMHYALRRPGKK